MHPVQTGIGVDADGDASTPAGTENIGTTVPTPSPPPCTRPDKSTQKPKGQGHPPQLAYAPPGEYRASTKTIRGEYSVPLGAMALPLVSHIGPGLNIVNISCEQRTDRTEASTRSWASDLRPLPHHVGVLRQKRLFNHRSIACQDLCDDRA